MVIKDNVFSREPLKIMFSLDGFFWSLNWRVKEVQFTSHIPQQDQYYGTKDKTIN